MPHTIGRDIMRQTIKLGLLPYGVAIRERRAGVMVLVYHRVGGRSGRQDDLPIELFEWQMQWLREHARVISLGEVVAIAAQDLRYQHDVVAITFDDGYDEIYTKAFPILAAFRFPATIYLSTSCIETGQPFPFKYGTPSESRGRPLRWEQAALMQESGLIEIGAHTHSHRNLTLLTRDEIRREIDQANELIVRRLGTDPIHFAYPWGRVSHAAKDYVDRSYQTAAVGGTCKNPYGNIDLHTLRRVPIQRSDGRLFFQLKLKSYLQGEEWLRQIFDGRRRPSAAESTAAVI